MKRLGSKFFGAAIGLLLFTAEAHAVDVCPSPNQPAGTAWCDPVPADPTRYLNDTLCVVEPIAGTSGSSIDEEVVGGGVCILGKFKDLPSVQKLVDFVVSYDFSGIPNMGEDLSSLPSGIFVPDLATMISGQDFMTTLPLDRAGPYNVTIQGRTIGDDGSLQDISLVRRILRDATPDLTITNARIGGSTGDCSASDTTKSGHCFGVQGVEGDSDGDGICDGPVAIPGVCTAGPDLSNDAAHAVELSPPANQRTSSVQLCVNMPDSGTSAGNEVLVRAVNTITDSSATPAKDFIIESNCAASGETKCQASTDAFCPGGFEVNVPLGNGKNDIELFVSNPVTGYDVGSGERLKVESMDVDLKGPALCVNYLNQAGHKIENADNRNILASEASAVTMDVTLGACGATPESVSAASPDGCDAGNPPDCGSSPICVQRNSEKNTDGSAKFVALCPHSGTGGTHYQAAFSDLRFPMNTALIKASDNAGNQTVETHTFGYGNVHALFTPEGQFDVKKAVIPNALGGFVGADYVKNELLPVLLKAVNTPKFKNDIFLKLLDPHQPNDKEASCLKSIEGTVNSSFDHLASKEKDVAIKFFCDGDCTQHIGDIEIPSLYFLNENRLRLQLKVKGMHGRAEMYTIQFADTDNDGIVDTEDDDADNDGICDHFVSTFEECVDANGDGVCDAEVGLTGSQGKGLNASGKCILDKTIAQKDCKDPEVKNAKDYFGCSDQDDDNDGVPDDHDLPGRIVPDPDFGTMVLPLTFQVKEMALNLDVQFVKDANGRLQVSISGVPGRDMVEAIADSGNLIDFDCDKDVSEIYQGGRADEDGNGRNLWIDGEACRALKSLSNGLNGNGGVLQGGLISTSEFLGLVDRHRRQNQGTNQQLIDTISALTMCSIPKRLEATLDKFENDKVAAFSVKILDNRYHMDLFAPLGSADVEVDPRGLGFKGGGLLAPAGVTDPNDTAERNAKDFMAALPTDFKNPKFGPLSQASDVDPVDPIEAAFQMGAEGNLAVAEEMVNSVLHSTGLLLWDLAKHEGENHQSLDLSAKNLRETFDFGIPNIGDTTCLDKNGQKFDPSQLDGGTSTNYKCFPFPLDTENVIGPTTVTYVDFDGDGVAGSDNDKKAPFLIRTTIDPQSPPAVRLVSVSPLQAWDGSSSAAHPAVLMAEVEVDLSNVGMSLFEEKVADWHADVIQGTGEIKDWCDSDRYPGANQAKCTAGHKLPMVTFNASGRVFATLLLSVKDKGIIRVEGGLSSVEKASGASAGNEMDLDRTKTYLTYTVAENNTIIPDDAMIAAFSGQVDLLLSKFVFGNARDIRGNIPAELPLEAYCAAYQDASPDFCDCVAHPEKADCDIAHTLQRAWDRIDLDQYGVEGVTLDRTVLGVTADDLGPRYLTIGADSTIKLKDN